MDPIKKKGLTRGLQVKKKALQGASKSKKGAYKRPPRNKKSLTRGPSKNKIMNNNTNANIISIIIISKCEACGRRWTNDCSISSGWYAPKQTMTLIDFIILAVQWDHLLAGRRPASWSISTLKVLVRVREAPDLHTHIAFWSNLAKSPDCHCRNDAMILGAY